MLITEIEECSIYSLLTGVRKRIPLHDGRWGNRIQNIYYSLWIAKHLLQRQTKEFGYRSDYAQ